MTEQESSKSETIPELELATIEFWNKNEIYKKSLMQRQGCPPFVFYEGPPTANGIPHPGHCLTRAIKDLYPRYKTMRGFYCERKAGWDTHGLPVEVEVCKELGIHSKEEIEAYGIKPFVNKCLESVFRYTKQWEDLTQRLGFWIDLEKAYITYERSFVESVWWSLKNLFERGLLYQGHKIVWWWAQGGTALSSGEVGQGYREVADPSVFVRFPLVDEKGVDLLVWTTTPWTLPSNQFVAVHPEFEYSLVSFADESGTEDERKIILASELIETIATKIQKTATIKKTFIGKELIGKRYVPPFDYYYKNDGEKLGTLVSGEKEHVAWRIVAADFVTTESGTGLVHEAPAFGEVDFDVLKQESARFSEGEGPSLICAVDPNGKFTAEAPDYQGRWVKEADKDINRNLKERGLLFLLEQYLHDYPFCWRASQDPLIQYPRKSWFIKTTEFKDAMLSNNENINWYPEHIKHGRFGNFLESNVDWALSRERYWGTPLPIWVCEETGKMQAIGSYAELLSKPGISGTEMWENDKKANPELPEHLCVHKPYIDEMTYESPFASGKRMRRVTEVIDCWYDAGAMPFAQWGYPHLEGSEETFKKNFPADFISEALDQTRGWFYSQLAISTMIFDAGDFKNCIVLGLMLGEDGTKMSKSLRNYRTPDEIFDRYGADALRWYFYATQPPWTAIRYNEQAIKDSMPEFILRLSNVASFFEVYASIDGFDREGSRRPLPVSERCELDRWIVSELNITNTKVVESMDAYDHYAACASLTAFVDSLSNWYVRRSRDRFWSSKDASEAEVSSKIDAYSTLSDCLITTAKMIAPFVPFLAERMWNKLVNTEKHEQSVHLCEYPMPDDSLIDAALSKRMGLIREIVSLGRNARMNAKLKVRQPLARLEVVLADRTEIDWLKGHSELIEEELNLKEVDYIEKADKYITYSVLPDFKILGKKLGKALPELKNALATADGAALLSELESAGKIVLTLSGGPVELGPDEIQVRLQAKDGWAAAQGSGCVVVLSTELSPELLAEGCARELVRIIQDRRKELDCEYTDRIAVNIATKSDKLLEAVGMFGNYIKKETLALSLETVPCEAAAESVSLKVDGEPLELTVVVRK